MSFERDDMNNYFSIDTIKNFINIPINATGALNASGSIVGNTFNPHLQGKFAFVDAAFQGQNGSRSNALDSTQKA